MPMHRVDGSDPSHALSHALDLYKAGLADLRSAAEEAGVDEWAFHNLADASGMPIMIGADKASLNQSAGLEPFIRRR